MKGALVVLLATVAAVSCKKMLGNGVGCDDIKTIIKSHNDLRMKVAKGEQDGQPKAANMQKLAWDENLAKIAQKWANRMKFEHNPHRKDSRWTVGENAGLSQEDGKDTTSDWPSIVQAWYNEVENYTFAPMQISGPVFEATGHYTQTVWADTTLVGCGFASYEEDGLNNKLYVCDYGPAGNWDGSYPYKTGAGCEDLCCQDQCDALHGPSC